MIRKINTLVSLHFWLALVLLSPLCLHVSSAQQSKLRSGPMVGYGEMTEVMLWVQTTEPATVQFQYWDIENPKQKLLSPQVRTSEEKANIAHVRISGLKPGRKFEYEVLIDGKLVKRPYRLAFQTQPLWQWRTDPPEFTLAIGSCAYVNEPEWDRPGDPYGGDYEIFATITAKKPDLMIWMGDNVYYREVDWNTVSGMRHRYSHTRALPEMQPLLGATHNYAIWDDHDYGPDNSDRSFRMRSAAWETFQLFWANPPYGTDEVKGVFTRFQWADVDFFLLDNRYHRSPNDAPNDATKVMFGKEQLQWLIDGLVSSRAPFKVVVGGNQMLKPAASHEAFCNFPHEYRQLLGALKEQKIFGVVFLSGDIHNAELSRLPDPDFYPLYDFTSSPLTAGLYRGESNNPIRVPGTHINDMRNFGLLRFSGPRRDRKVALECYDVKGNLRWSHEIKASELRLPENRSPGVKASGE
jgi:alkaline phosphatase D